MQGAHIDEIRKSFYALSKKYHPDVNPNGAEYYKDITEAWNVISDLEKRKVYDLKLSQKTFLYSGSWTPPKKSEPEYIGEFEFTITWEMQQKGFHTVRFPNNHYATFRTSDFEHGKQYEWTLAKRRYRCFITMYFEPEPSLFDKAKAWIGM
jgi:curved DNA-binding protein CbpA